MSRQPTEEFFAHPAFLFALQQAGLTNIDRIFALSGEAVNPKKMAAYRSRLFFHLPDGRGIFLKRFDHPSRLAQLRAWWEHRKRLPMAFYDRWLNEKLTALGINVPTVVAWGWARHGWFEQRSFVMLAQLPNAVSFEQRLPDCFADGGEFALRKQFIANVAEMVRRLHSAGFVHRDLYLCHLFWDATGKVYLIDLNRVIQPLIGRGRYVIKDLAQLHFSSPKGAISAADRLRFFKHYRQTERLTASDKRLARQIDRKARRIAARECRHNRPAPFLQGSAL